MALGTTGTWQEKQTTERSGVEAVISKAPGPTQLCPGATSLTLTHPETRTCSPSTDLLWPLQPFQWAFSLLHPLAWRGQGPHILSAPQIHTPPCYLPHLLPGAAAPWASEDVSSWLPASLPLHSWLSLRGFYAPMDSTPAFLAS